jgi:hypothetical protein
MDDGFNLTVTIPAVEMAYLRRRLMYLEAVVVQLLRQNQRMKEWFSAADLVELRLPGLPKSQAAITRAARAEEWRVKRSPRSGGGVTHLYHFSALPRRAFEALIDRVLQAAASDQVDDQAPAFAPPPPAQERPTAPNAAPPWVLPLMRIIRRQGASQPVCRALEQLPKHLPAGVACPTFDEAMQVLRSLGMVAG